jgi:ferredoxin
MQCLKQQQGGEEMAYTINDKCVSCDACRLQCPRNAISNSENDKIYEIDASLCNDCRNLPSVRCVPHCPVDAIVKA